MDDDFCNLKQVQFVSSTYFELFGDMMQINCQELAYRYLMLIESSCSFKAIGNYYNYITRKIKYYECYRTSQECEQVYKEFYATSMKLNEVNDALRVEHILSKFTLSKALFELKTMRKENKQLENASHIDKLTQLYNRRYLSKLQSKVMMGKKQILLGYVMLDIDYFKEYNDFYGHSKGDAAIVCVADVLKHNAMDRVYASRYGGDEFLVLFVDHTKESIAAYIEAVQTELKNRSVPHEKSRSAAYLTLSIGFCNGTVSNESMLHELLECADSAFYQAKEDGRNCYRYQTI